MSDQELVLTSRRALLRAGRWRWTRGRLRLTDRALRFTAHDGRTTEVTLREVASVRVTGGPRRALVLETAEGTFRVRCFGVTAVAGLLFR